MFNKKVLLILLTFVFINNVNAEDMNLFVNQEMTKLNNKNINDSILLEGQNELNKVNELKELDSFNSNNESNLNNVIKNKNIFTPLESKKVNDSETFTLKSLMDEYIDWNFAIDPLIVLDKEYRWSTFGTNEISSVLKDIGTYEDFTVIISETNKTIKMIKKVKTKFDISNFEEKDINYFLYKLKSGFTNTEIYRYKNTLYIEGNKLEVETAIEELNKFNNNIKKSISKFVVNIYKVDETNTNGLTNMIDIDNIKPEKQIVLKNPKIKKPYSINLGKEQLIIKINSNSAELNDVIISNKDFKFYGYKIKNWFITIKSIDI